MTHEERFQNIIHDMQSPLAALKLTTDLLDGEKLGPLNKGQKDLVASMKQSIEKLIKVAAEKTFN